MPHSPEELARITRAASQRTLFDFLSADLDLGFTMLQTAQIQAKDAPEHCQSTVTRARAILETIRALMGRLEDPEAWREIHSRANKLESALAVLPTRKLSEPYS